MEDLRREFGSRCDDLDGRSRTRLCRAGIRVFSHQRIFHRQLHRSHLFLLRPAIEYGSSRRKQRYRESDSSAYYSSSKRRDPFARRYGDTVSFVKHVADSDTDAKPNTNANANSDSDSDSNAIAQPDSCGKSERDSYGNDFSDCHGQTAFIMGSSREPRQHNTDRNSEGKEN
jgi:hypothetical protein